MPDDSKTCLQECNNYVDDGPETCTETGCKKQRTDPVLEGGLGKLAAIMDAAKHDQHLMPSYGLDEMEYPLVVESIQFGKLSAEENLTAACGKYVAIRPCDPNCEGKTYLGVMLGDFPSVPMAVYRPGEKKLLFATRTNPAIFVPDLSRVVWGMESWWGPIKDPDHLREITDESIQNLWYVQALKALFPAEGEDDGNDARGDHGSD